MFLIGGIQENKKIIEKVLYNFGSRKLDNFRINVKIKSKKEIRQKILIEDFSEWDKSFGRVCEVLWPLIFALQMIGAGTWELFKFVWEKLMDEII